METVFYVHGKGGSAAEAAHYAPLFPGCGAVGAEYDGTTPRTAAKDLRAAAEKLKKRGGVILIANSIGAYFSMCAGLDTIADRAYFISPVLDMEGLIRGRMAAENVTEEALAAQGELPSVTGEPFSAAYLSYVREHPARWDGPAEILYADGDALTPRGTAARFARRYGAGLTVMEHGEHWFHTPEQMRFLDGWILKCERRYAAAAYPIRRLDESEIPAALALAWRVFSEYESPVYPPEGTEEFRKSINDETYLAGIRYYGAFDGTTLIGEIGIRPANGHICFFFVDGRYHRRGTGTALFRFLLRDIPDGDFTLNAAPYGLPFYKALGFEPTDAEQTVNGIRFTPMRYGCAGDR